MPGLIGLNNIKNTDYVNVVVQSLSRVPPLRDFFLLPANYAHVKSNLVKEFGALLRKMWSPHNFKGQVSPHELLQAVAHESDNRYKIGTQTDPMDFLGWLLNALHAGLGGTRKPGSSIIHKAFQGQVQIKTYKAAKADTDADIDVETQMTPFLYLTVDVPPAPLFRDALERNIIPQVRRASSSVSGKQVALHHPTAAAMSVARHPCYPIQTRLLSRRPEHTPGPTPHDSRWSRRPQRLGY